MQNSEVKSNGGSEIQMIRDDITALKEDTATLARDIRSKGGNITRDGLDQLREAGGREFELAVNYVREKPGQSVLLAFAAGLFASFVLGPRR